MGAYKLHCPDCDSEQVVEFRPWQTEPGKFGAVSSICGGCGEVRIHKLGDGVKLVIPEDAFG